MDAKRHKEILALCGAHSARTIEKLVSQKPAAMSVPDSLQKRGYGRNFLGASLTRRLALRLGLLNGDLAAMWRGLRQATRLRWLELELVGYKATDYTHLWEALDILATGDGEVFRRWLNAVPSRLSSGHPYCVVISNGLTAWGRDEPGLRRQALRGLSRARHSTAPNRYEKAAMGVLLGGFLDNASMTSSSLEDALREWRRVAWQDQWFYVHHLMALFNVARTMLSDDISVPAHERFIDPLAFDTPHRADLVDFSTSAPILHRWVTDFPEQLDTDAWTTTPLDDDEDPLLATIYASPGDDGPRLVYADWLMSHGDPRGEFIALQLHDKPSKEEKKRVKRWGQVHAGEWLAPLDRSRLTDVHFERGFLAACRVHSGPVELDDNPAWSTLVELHGAVPGKHTVMPLLRGLGGLKTLEPLAGLARPLPIERLAYVGGGVQHAQELDEGICPQLTELWILGQRDWVQGFEREGATVYATPQTLAWIIEAPFTRSLTRVVLPLACEHLAAFVTAWLLESPRLDELIVSTQAGEAWDSGWQLKIARHEGGLELHFASAPSAKAEHPSLFSTLLLGLRALPPGVIRKAKCDASIKKRPELAELQSICPELGFSRFPRRVGFWATSR